MTQTQFGLRRKQLVALVILTLFVSSLAVLYLFPSRSGIPDDTLIWEVIGYPDSMDPAVDNEQFGDWVLSNIYENLYTYPFNSSATYPLVPLVAAEQPVISADGKNYTIELRQGITFHDGTPLNASCVKWNIERAMKIFAEWSTIVAIADVLKGGAQVKEAALANGTMSSVFRAAFDDWVANSSAIETPDVYIVRFVLESPFSPFIALLATRAASVVSPSYVIAHASSVELATWQAYGVDYGESNNYMTNHTCGSGPYRLVNWLPSQYTIELNLFENYWRNTDLSPELPRPSNAGSITKVYIRTNVDTAQRELNLKTGVVDGVYWPISDAYDIWSPNETVNLNWHIHMSTGGLQYDTVFLGFNMRNLTAVVDSTTVTTESPFANKNFRRAASFAFDYQKFIELEINGFGTPGRGPIPIGMTGHNGSSFAFDYSITAAVVEWNLAMLDSEFVSSLNSLDNTLAFYYIMGSTLRNASAGLLKEGLDDVFRHPGANHTGLNDDMIITVEGISFSDYLDYLAESRLLVSNYGWIAEYADPINYLYPLCHSDGIFAQRIGYNNTDVDLWYELAISESDPLQRQVYFNHIQDTIADDAPYLWAYQGTEFRTWREGLFGDGFIFNPMRDIYFYHIFKGRIVRFMGHNYSASLIEIMLIPLLSYLLRAHFVTYSAELRPAKTTIWQQERIWV